AAFRLGAVPISIEMTTCFYGCPEHDEVPGVKIALHQLGEEATPSTVRREVDEADRAAVRECARRRFTGLTDRITYEKVCLYTNTPTEDFIVDRHPADSRIVFVAGLSGHGFKFILLLGQIAAALATDGSAPYDIRRFSASRWGTMT